CHRVGSLLIACRAAAARGPNAEVPRRASRARPRFAQVGRAVISHDSGGYRQWRNRPRNQNPRCIDIETDRHDPLNLRELACFDRIQGLGGALQVMLAISPSRRSG
uniref:hypothetical protein n=1 Tax=uncultured Thiocystis sp. TaxID=1202134 RepID=UPI0025F2DE7E